MSKGRLEEIQQDVNYAYRKDGSINIKAVTMHIEDYEYLYKQAERVQELEDAIKGSTVITNIASDEIAELESAHRMMLARNKRLEKENAKLMQLNTNLWNKSENYVAVLRWIVNVGTDPQSVSKAQEILKRYGRDEKQDA